MLVKILYIHNFDKLRPMRICILINKTLITIVLVILISKRIIIITMRIFITIFIYKRIINIVYVVTLIVFKFWIVLFLRRIWHYWIILLELRLKRINVFRLWHSLGIIYWFRIRCFRATLWIVRLVFIWKILYNRFSSRNLIWIF
jgi:hypothetical protein